MKPKEPTGKKKRNENSFKFDDPQSSYQSWRNGFVEAL